MRRICCLGRFCLAVTIGLGAAAMPFETAEAAPIPLRGIIEGFYGTPWQMQERLDILSFAHKSGYNAYIYAPKDDPYHREKWREPYPADKLAELGQLVKQAKKENVHFIFAVSPGLDVSLHGYKSLQDEEKMLIKLESLYSLGVRDFAIFFDDIKDKDGAGQAAFLNHIYARMKLRHGDLGNFLTVPTEYFYEDMVTAEGTRKSYTDAFAKNLNPHILVLYTGEGVAKAPLTDAELEKADKLYGRALGVWWNYPVTDYMENKLALGPMDELPKKGLPAVFFNPMKYEALSRIALATGADYAKDPAHYSPEKSWQQAVCKQYGPAAQDMLLFAANSRHLENDWANIGLPDDPDFQQKAAKMWQSWPNGRTFAEDYQAVAEAVKMRQRSAVKLQQNLPPAVLDECRPQLLQYGRLADASETARLLLSAKKQGKAVQVRSLQQKLAYEKKVIEQHKKEATLSEQAMGAFIQRAEAAETAAGSVHDAE
ncbi:MAG: protein O-GlcNAcase [Mitsuokella sp.]|uniref:protein O-GlcNAcase n=2 Tax=unclassified Mitsuokella TaxID=2637239 RepID=UPI003F038AE3